ncbi:alpha-1,3-mannosyl-glycoprotein 4-beta-N-acetylglucosaminyltransferase B [Diabrotica virgifera virgifera]|uniref:Alpha-1,3-mannosyl-glycoprotein 4-beta-N-acetylglucosaminyltransferase B n=1 Tax=Diabrotica virgifera virgifera TaxID=50390 RepID=A0ABM5KU94_DIAVI|nr:alpha-1,3-mannosyl-glycoprotein 4-beta-N-acetylglucosaminyltransferase B [Diabrotica virgifera virgifera]
MLSSAQLLNMTIVNLSMSSLRKRNCFFVFIFIVFVPFCLFVILSVPDISSEETLLQRLAELQVRIQYLDAMYRSRQEELQELTQHIDQIYNEDSTLNSSANVQELRPDIKQMLKNMSGLYAANGLNPGVSVKFPSAFHFLPHLLDNPNSLKLAYLMSKNREGVSLVLGIPTVKREKYSYLMDTLQNLIDGLSPEEANDTIIVILIAETAMEYILQIAKEVEMKFPSQVESGLIEIIAPSSGYYPNFDKLRITLGDSSERVKWRSKQNLDYAFLMSYCQTKGTFYVQLEDDILAKPSYATIMRKFAIEKTAKKDPWIVLDFCQLGFIGKLFKTAELPWLINFFQMFFNDKPVDWLLDYLITTKICNWEKNDNCKADKAKVWIHYKPSLFQHIGMHSSLKGKVQKLKDKQFGKVALFFPHNNPPAEVVSGIKHYKQYTLKRAYLGETFFWGLLPQPGDQLLFNLTPPVTLKRFYFRSGNAEHPTDKFYNTTVEVKPVQPIQNLNFSNVTQDGFIIIGKFDSAGIASGSLNNSIGKISSLRLNVHSESDNWAILSEIHLQDDSRIR